MKNITEYLQELLEEEGAGVGAGVGTGSSTPTNTMGMGEIDFGTDYPIPRGIPKEKIRIHNRKKRKKKNQPDFDM